MKAWALLLLLGCAAKERSFYCRHDGKCGLTCADVGETEGQNCSPQSRAACRWSPEHVTAACFSTLDRCRNAVLTDVETGPCEWYRPDDQALLAR